MGELTDDGGVIRFEGTISGGGTGPIGPAGGDLAGVYPNPTLASGANGFWKTVGGVFGRVASVAWAELTGVPTLDAMPVPTADLSLNTHHITDVVDPANAQDAATKAYVDAHAGGVGASDLIYRYTVTGADKASIDTGVDAPDAGSNVWTSGDLLEIELYLRTDEVVVFSAVALTLNNDGGANYDRILIQVANATVTGLNTLAQTRFALNAAGASLAANVFAVYRISFPGYGATVGFKAGELTGGVVDSVAANTLLQNQVYLYRSTTAISRVAVAPITAGRKLKVGTELLIYKRRAA